MKLAGSPPRVKRLWQLWTSFRRRCARDVDLEQWARDVESGRQAGDDFSRFAAAGLKLA